MRNFNELENRYIPQTFHFDCNFNRLFACKLANLQIFVGITKFLLYVHFVLCFVWHSVVFMVFVILYGFLSFRFLFICFIIITLKQTTTQKTCKTAPAIQIQYEKKHVTFDFVGKMRNSVAKFSTMMLVQVVFSVPKSIHITHHHDHLSLFQHDQNKTDSVKSKILKLLYHIDVK